MKKLTIFALIAAAAAGTAVAIALTKRKHDASCRYDADEVDEYEDECCCDACGVCDICEDEMEAVGSEDAPDEAACEDAPADEVADADAAEEETEESDAKDGADE